MERETRSDLKFLRRGLIGAALEAPIGRGPGADPAVIRFCRPCRRPHKRVGDLALMALTTFRNLDPGAKKGQNGTVLVIGGSLLYTGAPVFSARSALRAGADLVYVLCMQEALGSIKSLHEAIVMPIAYDRRVLRKITACVLGPGLGRVSPDTLRLITKIVRSLNARAVPIVVDADGIHYYKRGHFSFVDTCVVTPNYREKTGLSVRRGHVCVLKGAIDIVALDGEERAVDTPNSEKRCGGQGDILSGVLASALSIGSGGDIVDACVSACILAREASHAAFAAKGFGLMTTDIIEEIPGVLKKARQ